MFFALENVTLRKQNFGLAFADKISRFENSIGPLKYTPSP